MNSSKRKIISTVCVIKAPSMVGKYLWNRREVEFGNCSVILLKEESQEKIKFWLKEEVL